jgi:FkbM family methyltransferase
MSSARGFSDQLKSVVKGVAHKAGLDVQRAHGSLTHVRSRLIELNGVDTIIDVGANRGQYALDLRRESYAGAIVSVEPLPTALAVLETRAARDPRWSVVPAAVSSSAGFGSLRISGNEVSSSLQDMEEAHRSAAPESAIVGVVDVKLVTLDELIASLPQRPERLGIKIDVQGHELAVIAGGAQSLRTAIFVEVELSLTALYAGQGLLPEVLAKLQDIGLELVQLRPVFSDAHTGRLLQIDGLLKSAAATL